MAGVSAQSGGDAPKDYSAESNAPKDYNAESDAPKDYNEESDAPKDPKNYDKGADKPVDL